MTAREIQRHGSCLVCLGAVMLAVAGCDSEGPTRPTPRDAPGVIRSSSTLVRIDIAGPDTIAPGEGAQFIATGHFEDGSSLDLTQEVSWSGTSQTLAGSAVSGFYTGKARGAATVDAGVHVPVYVRASKQVLVLPTGTYRLTGRVVEAEKPGPVSGATVAIDGDPDLSVRTASDGSFRIYGVVGSVELRVTMPGYVNDARRLLVDGDQSVEVPLTLLKPRPDLNGVFTMTVRVDPQCTSSVSGYSASAGPLPDELGTRTYTADLTQTGNMVKLRLSGYTPPRGFRLDPTFSGGLEPGVMTIGLGSFLSYRAEETLEPGIVETLSPSSFVIVDGKMTLSTDTLAGTLRGAVMWFDKQPSEYASPISLCWSETHHVRFTR